MKIIIADNCTLILLSKCTLLADLAVNFTVIIPEAVLNEVVNKKFCNVDFLFGLYRQRNKNIYIPGSY